MRVSSPAWLAIAAAVVIAAAWVIFTRATAEERYREKLVHEVYVQLVDQLVECSRLDLTAIKLEGGQAVRSSTNSAVLKVRDRGLVRVELIKMATGWRVLVYRDAAARPCRAFALSPDGAIHSE